MAFDWKNKSTLFFDLDGTLVDSSPGHSAAFKQVLREYFGEKEANEFDYRIFKGRMTREVVDEWLAEHHPTWHPHRVDELTERKQVLFFSKIDPVSLPLFPRVRECLEVFLKEKKKMYVVTGSRGKTTEAILQAHGVRPWFESVIAAEDTERGKPDPAPYLEALRRAQVPPSEVLVFEDSCVGQKSAERAGIECVVVHNPDLSAWTFKNIWEQGVVTP